jgi:hypothetical protein
MPDNSDRKWMIRKKHLRTACSFILEEIQHSKDTLYLVWDRYKMKIPINCRTFSFLFSIGEGSNGTSSKSGCAGTRQAFYVLATLLFNYLFN